MFSQKSKEIPIHVNLNSHKFAPVGWVEARNPTTKYLYPESESPTNTELLSKRESIALNT